jgi:CHASE2 domain-containing sensor protein
MKLTYLLLGAILTTGATAGPLAYGICQAGCATLVMACYGAAGFTWGKPPAPPSPD